MGALKLNTTEYNKFIRNVITFLIPLVILYLGQVVATLNVEGNLLELVDFIPSSVTLGGMAYYVMSTLIDYKKKLDESSR